MKRIGGIINDWWLEYDLRLRGKIINDSEYQPQTYIITSQVVVLDLEKKQVETQNTYYKLGNMKGKEL